MGLFAGFARKVLENTSIRIKVGTLAFLMTCYSRPVNLLNLCSHSVLQEIDATLFCFATDELEP
ncbi:hypothetical protein HA38_04920 [Pantoea allii]|nr:hypothetical protein HA38_04920 [Pantoea allii]